MSFVRAMANKLLKLAPDQVKHTARFARFTTHPSGNNIVLLLASTEQISQYREEISAAQRSVAFSAYTRRPMMTSFLGVEVPCF